MRIHWLVLGSVVVAGSLALSLSADEASDRRQALRQAEEPLRDRRWADAVPALKAVRARDTCSGTRVRRRRRESRGR